MVSYDGLIVAWFHTDARDSSASKLLVNMLFVVNGNKQVLLGHNSSDVFQECLWAGDEKP